MKKCTGERGVGLPFQRRWLNHRNVGDGPGRLFPSAAMDSTTAVQSREVVKILLKLGEFLACEKGSPKACRQGRTH